MLREFSITCLALLVWTNAVVCPSVCPTQLGVLLKCLNRIMKKATQDITGNLVSDAKVSGEIRTG